MSKHIMLPRLNQLAASIAVVVGGMAFIPSAFAAAPAAGTNISNVASASYVDNTSTTRNVTSNEVKTTVLQVASFTLVADRSEIANPNSQVSLKHTLTNTGNGADTFTLNLVNVGGDDYDFSNIRIYADADGNGVADNTINLIGQTVSLNAGDAFNFVVVGTTSGTATDGQQGILNVTATNVLSTTPAGGSNAATSRTNVDTVTIANGPVIKVNKAASLSTVKTTDSVANRTIEYTLTYQNIGNAPATNVMIEDVLPANVTYVAGSGKWSGSATARTDADDAETGVTYKLVGGKITAVIANVPVNATGTLKFKVVVNTTAPAGNITNTATYDEDGDGPNTPTTPTNDAVTEVQKILTGTINDSQADAYADADKDTGNTAKDDLITATTSQGVPVSFGNNGGETIWVHNTGNVDETYNLTINKAGLPAGSIVELLKADGVTPLTDTNGDPVVDTGPIAPGAAQKIVVRVTLPTGYTGPVTAPGLDTIVTIAPVNNAAATPDTITLRITNVTAARVDLSNGRGDENGIDDDTPAAGEGQNTPYIVDDKTTKPGVAVNYPLAITNFGTTSDNYNVSSNLPAGWTVQYVTSDAAGNCTTTPINNNNTGNILAGQTGYICAVVTPPANATPADSRDIIFTVTSPASGLSDTIRDHVVIDEVRALTFTPDRQGQTSPGGTVTYIHTLTNTGNVNEGVGGAGQSTLPIAVSSTLNGVTTSVYVDLNSNGIADANELVTGNDLTPFLATTPGGAGLQPGEAVSIIVKVQTPAGAANGQQDVSTVTVTPTGTINGEPASPAVKVEDTTTIITEGNVSLEKYQAIDATCDGTADTAFGKATVQAKPGACIIYKIDATNGSSTTVTNVVVSDAVPAYTTLTTPAPALTPASKGTPVVNGNSITTTPGFSLDPTEVATLQFSVKIND